MAEIQPLMALHYDLQKTGGLQDVVSPPYDVIDAEQRAGLVQRSPYNVVEIDLPQGEDPYAKAAQTLDAWRADGIVKEDEDPAMWVLEQDYTGPDGRQRTRTGFLARVRVTPYGPGTIRPHERTHPGPREDRLRLTRATKANLSPIFSLYSDADGTARVALEDATEASAPYAQTTDDDGTVNRLWRTSDPDTIAKLKEALEPAELLIADGHHRYETARVYADEIGGEGPHRYALMCLVALEDPGLTVFPTHRLVNNLTTEQQEKLTTTIETDFSAESLASENELAPPENDELMIGYIDSQNSTPTMLTLKDQSIADEALPDHAEPYRHLDTAVLEALILKGALGLTDERIDHLDGLGYARDFEQALELIENGSYDAAFFMAPTPVERIQAVAASGENMPPKSTYFYPKVPTGLVFNPL
ncbi:MAG TPA: DUF1015 domain-containing protein [Solirubrobacteraceae bacterium]|nr:DUF1015 domain-containing protein [Solirubrobacteraceae bacterium]